MDEDTSSDEESIGDDFQDVIQNHTYSILSGSSEEEKEKDDVKKRAKITPELNDTKRVNLDVHVEEEPTDTEEDRLNPDTTLRGYSVSEIDSVFLNIGGMYFETSLQTLTLDQTSLFALSSRNGELGESRTLTYDRDPTHFRMVINHLRNRLFTDTRTLPDNIGQLLECLQEAQYYELGALQRTVVSKLEQLTVVSPLTFPRWTYSANQ
ncbi:BTB/POZ domain-containing adapter for CUL3-mediated RhoA degradation protein 3-like [Ruditapes philippinarum]|uniref:BTB/POZ domain-containing adapter for CUL3-mediated RhoA degradation protein 3-like n=1 Tax=Ruditapes philippinarum TaxID=129788 RepID=UPI00295BAA5C|nr:BTB/POZ domain-containing adapter for CUL3-mediated RhoA degradation protein 3-like [Ruditapes philippinarum]